jgi:hypothetical protein
VYNVKFTDNDCDNFVNSTGIVNNCSSRLCRIHKWFCKLFNQSVIITATLGVDCTRKVWKFHNASVKFW